MYTDMAMCVCVCVCVCVQHSEMPKDKSYENSVARTSIISVFL